MENNGEGRKRMETVTGKKVLSAKNAHDNPEGLIDEAKYFL